MSLAPSGSYLGNRRKGKAGSHIGWFDGLIGGFQNRHYYLEAEQLRQAERRNDQESRIFQQLLTSPDPEVKALAATGLLTSAQSPKRKGGFRGWLGELETNPMLDQIKALIGTKKETVFPGLPTTQSSGYIGTPPGTAASAAQIASSPTEAGSAAMTTPKPWVNPGPWRGGLGDTEMAPESLRPPAATDPVLAQMPADVGTPPPEPFTGPHRGLLEPGTVDLYGQPSVPNPKGGMSTVYSQGYNVDGEEVLLPAVTPDGRFLATPEEVIAEYRRTGRHLGKFSDPDAGTEYGDKLHNDYEAGVYDQRPEPGAVGTSGDALPSEVGTPPAEPVISGAVENPTVTWAHPEVSVSAAAPEPIPTLPGVSPEVGVPPRAPDAVINKTRSVGPERVEYTDRQIFQTPEGQMRLTTLARENAEHEADRAYYKSIGFTDEEIKKLEQDRVRRTLGGVGMSYAEGNAIPDPESPTGYSQELYLRSDPTKKIKISAPGPNIKMGNALEEAAAILFPGMSAADVREQRPDEFKRVSDLATQIAANRAGGLVTAKGAAAAKVPFTQQEAFQDTQALTTQYLNITAKARDMEESVAKLNAAEKEMRKDPSSLNRAAEAITVLWERTLDPNSVVREAEARRPAEFSGLRQRLQGWYDRLSVGGAPITKEELVKYVAFAKELQRATAAVHEDDKDRIAQQALDWDLNPGHIIAGWTPKRRPTTGGGAAAPAQPAAPPATAPDTSGRTIDSTAPGLYVDDDGNLVER